MPQTLPTACALYFLFPALSLRPLSLPSQPAPFQPHPAPSARRVRLLKPSPTRFLLTTCYMMGFSPVPASSLGPRCVLSPPYYYRPPSIILCSCTVGLPSSGLAHPPSAHTRPASHPRRPCVSPGLRRRALPTSPLHPPSPFDLMSRPTDPVFHTPAVPLRHSSQQLCSDPPWRQPALRTCVPPEPRFLPAASVEYSPAFYAPTHPPRSNDFWVNCNMQSDCGERRSGVASGSEVRRHRGGVACCGAAAASARHACTSFGVVETTP